MRFAPALLVTALLLTACSAAPPAPSPAATAPDPAPNLVGALPFEDDWRERLQSRPGQETLEFCLALTTRGGNALEQASGRACLANISLLSCPDGETSRCTDAALEQVGAALELAPEARRLHLGRLRVLLDAGRAGELAPALLDSLARRPGTRADVPVWLGYAVELIESRRLRPAAAFVETLRTRFPDEPEVLATLGACLTDLSRHDRAGEVLGHGIDVAPDDPTLNWAMGWHHQRRGRLPSARAYFENALANAPDEATLTAWGCELGHLLEQAAELGRACELQQEHCADGVSALCSGRIQRR
jgi:Flp pilus assembly protein TadD